MHLLASFTLDLGMRDERLSQSWLVIQLKFGAHVLGFGSRDDAVEGSVEIQLPMKCFNLKILADSLPGQELGVTLLKASKGGKPLSRHELDVVRRSRNVRWV